MNAYEKETAALKKAQSQAREHLNALGGIANELWRESETEGNILIERVAKLNQWYSKKTRREEQAQ